MAALLVPHGYHMGMALQLPTMVHAIPKGGLILRPVPWINRKLSVYHNTTRRWRVHSQRKLEEHVGVESQGDEPPLLVFDEEAREESESRVKDRSLIGRLWVLAVLGATYVHNSVSAFALPALLPQISGELGLEDFQAALLTSGYSVIYALSLIPAGESTKVARIMT